MISNCCTCEYRDNSIVLTSNPPEYNCLNRNSCKQYGKPYDYCKHWKAKTPDTSKIKTVTTNNENIVKPPEGKSIDLYSFIMNKDLQKIRSTKYKLETNLRRRIQKHEDKVGKLEESVEVLDGRTESKEKPKQETSQIPKIKIDKLVDAVSDFKWIVHRTLRKKGIETYVGHRTFTDYDDVKCGYTMIYQKKFATKYLEKEAIEVRDELNEHRIGKRYLWVISKVEE